MRCSCRASRADRSSNSFSVWRRCDPSSRATVSRMWMSVSGFHRRSLSVERMTSRATSSRIESLLSQVPRFRWARGSRGAIRPRPQRQCRLTALGAPRSRRRTEWGTQASSPLLTSRGAVRLSRPSCPGATCCPSLRAGRDCPGSRCTKSRPGGFRIPRRIRRRSAAC